MNLSFFEEPTQVIEYFKAKSPELHFDYDEIMHYAHHKSFTVAKITKLDLLKDIQTSLTQAMQNGESFKRWKKGLKPTLIKNGWYGEVDVTNPKTGEVKQIYVGSRRLKNIYNTNMRTSYALSRYEAQMNSDSEYFRYTAHLDSRTRASHAKLHGLVLHRTHEFWDIHYPPNAWNCRCKVRAYTKKELERKGFKISSEIPLMDPHPDWAYNVGKRDNLDAVLNKKKTMFKAPLNTAALKEIKEFKRLRNLYVWQKSLDEMVKSISKGVIIKDKARQIAQIGELTVVVQKGLKSLAIEPKAKSISIYQNNILHITRDGKPKNKKPNDNEIRAVVGVLDKARHVFYDKSERVLLYFYESLQGDDMVNYAVIRLDYTLKKFKTDNFIATINKMPILNYKGILKDKARYMKVK